MFLIFLVVLTSGAAICVALFSTIEMVGVPGLRARGNLPPPLRRRLANTGEGLIRIYVWVGWAAYCAWFALVFGSQPGTPNPWIYYVTAIAVTGVPVVYLHLKEQWASTSDEEQTGLRQASNLWRTLVLCTCATFLILPQLMTVPYGWLAHVNALVSRGSDGHLTNRILMAEEHVFPSANSRAMTPVGTRSGTVPDPTRARSGSRVTDTLGPTGAYESDCQNELLSEGFTPVGAGAVSPCTATVTLTE